MIIDVAPGQVEGKKGLVKTIDRASEKLALNILQVTMYSAPLSSTIRENCSNSIDAIREKKIAKEIITGKAKVSDYYVERIGEEFEASKFDKNYYDLDWLSDTNKVTITYKENDGIGFCDRLTIEDTGVGISPNRFVRVVGLLWSTKRNNLNSIGGFGCGLKSGLATEVDYFTIESCWNGKKIIANCYKYKTDFVIGKFNLETGKENNLFITDFIQEDNTPIQLYYEEVDCKNYTKVIIPSKKINRSKYKEAVETQLMYFQDVDFYIIDESDYKREVNFKCKVLYNSKNIVVSDNNYYTRPHICVVKTEDDQEFINYGLLSFEELELETKYGAIGIKCTPRVVVQDEDGVDTVIQEGITVNPSRERVVFNEATKNYLINKINEVTKEASQLVEKELVESDFIVWLSKASKVLTKLGVDNSSILGRMSGIIDKSEISPIFGNTNIRFKSPEFIFGKYGINCRVVKKYNDYKDKKDKIQRDELGDWSYFNPNNIYIQTGDSSPLKDLYLNTTVTSGSFITIKEGDLDKFLESIKHKVPDTVKGDEYINQWKLAQEQKEVKLREQILTNIYKSPSIKSYEDVIVPEDWKKKLEELEQKVDEKGEIVNLTPQEKRKLEEKIVVQTLRKDQEYYNTQTNSYSFEKKEPKIIDFKDEVGVYYGIDEDKELLHIAANILERKYNIKTRFNYSNNSNTITNFYLDNFKLVKVAEVIAKKHCKNHNKIQSLFYSLNNKFEMQSTEQIRNWYTAKLIDEQEEKLNFFTNYGVINKELADLHKELIEFSATWYDAKEHESNKFYGSKYIDTIKVLDNMKEMQLFVLDHLDNSEAIKDKALELFKADAVTNATILNMDMYNKLQILLQYSEPVQALFNNVKFLTNEQDITFEQEKLIREVVELKELTDFKTNLLVVDEVILEPILEEIT